ncbi:hypothetical protein NHH03_13015 [Stieleria sp. TO1_6]|uniref:hypothetical protein n=1 Tax=Stieleria tagensis TaxID=2956795 RepID=UPI00209A9FA5|nr:hypothetical protein [Stieleria tagensis]MCO8122661.1 hypothetical protein [Stieleria tagensis]
MEYLRSKARELADKNWSRDEVLAYLTEQGVVNVDADDMVEEEFRSVRSENRRSGFFQLLSGFSLLGLSFVIFGGGILWTGLIVASLGLIVGGCIRLLTGQS